MQLISFGLHGRHFVTPHIFLLLCMFKYVCFTFTSTNHYILSGTFKILDKVILILKVVSAFENRKLLIHA